MYVAQFAYYLTRFGFWRITKRFTLADRATYESSGEFELLD